MELSFNANKWKFVFCDDGNGGRGGWMKASKFPWHAALFSGSALRCGLMDMRDVARPPMDMDQNGHGSKWIWRVDMASVLGTEGRRFEPHDGCIIVLGYPGGIETLTTTLMW